MTILPSLVEKNRSGIKSLAILIDPDKVKSSEDLYKICAVCAKNSIDYILVGGSLLVSGSLSETVELLKSEVDIPIVLFPGSNLHIDKKADGILFLSLISGRNPDLLIGQHVSAAPLLKKSDIEILPTGYLLVGDDANTTVAHISQTSPIPTMKSDIAVCTAMAGEMLGLKLIYLDAGSGAKKEVPVEMISGVKKTVSAPLIVGGGIDSSQKVQNAYSAGADVIVLGTVVEKNMKFIEEAAEIRNRLNA